MAEVEQVSEQVGKIATVSIGPCGRTRAAPPAAKRTREQSTCATRFFESAGSILKRAEPELVVSKQRFRQIEGIELVRIKREQRNQTLCFSSRPFVLCGLPVRKLPGRQLVYERRNGQFVLR